jgi:altronate dehydratase large subunit
MTTRAAGDMLVQEVIEVANGRKTKAEAFGFSDIAVDHICRYI